MNVIEAGADRRGEWDAYVERSPEASFYHLWSWQDINRDEFGHRTFPLAAVDDGRIVGILPVVQITSRLFGNLGCSMPFVNFGGPCSDSPAVEEALLTEARRLTDRERFDYLEIRSTRRLAGELPCTEHKVSLTVDLDPNPDVVMASYKTDHRKHIKQAYKEGYTARFGGGELLDAFYDVLTETWRDMGTPLYAKSYFQRIVATFGPAIRIGLVMSGDDVAAAQLTAYHKGMAEGMWLGIRAHYRRQKAGYVLYWELIQDACRHEMRRYHLGRSSVDSGSETFKKKWLAYPTQLYWHYVLRGRKDLPGLNVNNPKFQLAIKVWQELPMSVTRHLGPLVARSIP
jgi:FemAB-related protein (PEP-CTERM system-associated)